MDQPKLGTTTFLTYEDENQKSWVLLLMRNKKVNDFHSGKYVGIGGKLEGTETPYQTAIREIEEETGYVVSTDDLKFRGYVHFEQKNSPPRKVDPLAFHWIVFLYSAQVKEKQVINTSEGELEWIPVSKLSKIPMWGADYIYSEQILHTSNNFEYRFEYDENIIVHQELKRID